MKNLDYIVLDVDGTLTDGKIYYSENGDEIKAFNIKDGLALATLSKLGLNIMIITGRTSTIVSRRMKELGITECFQGVRDKLGFFSQYIEDNKIDIGRVLYIGDDINDLALMKKTGYRACPADACEEIKNISDYVSGLKGGEGAVRDVIEHFLKESDEWELVVKQYG